ncbi:MAG: DUF968 domain-containing protein [Pseudomonadota bacterium]|nr:DUF968 domain-containing protein [Pseudomonadota bacterium]
MRRINWECHLTYRSGRLRRIVASLPCACCGKSGPSQAAHSNLGMHGKGMGLKASDAATFPLCPDCHQEFDQGNKYTKDERYVLTMEWIAKTHIMLLEEGLMNP